MTSQRNLVLVQLGVVIACAAAMGGEPRDSSNRQGSRSESARLIAGNGEALRGGIANGTIAAAGGAHFDLRPIRAIGSTYTVVGNTITVKQTPANVLLEGYFGGWAPGLLKTVSLTLDPESLASGPGAPLGHGQIPCSTDADCRTALGVTGNAPELRCDNFWAGQCDTMFQDYSNPAWLSNVLVPYAISDLYNAGAVIHPPIPDPGTDRYDMSAVIHIPGGAVGTYEIAIDELDFAMNFLELPNDVFVLFGMVQPAIIQVLPDDACIGGMSSGMPCSQHSDCPGGACQLKNRFISFVPSEIAPTGGIQVTLVSLHAGSVMNPAAYNGTVRWVGPPTLGVSDVPSGPFNAAPLQCAFHSQDWTSAGRLHVYGPAVVPGSVYDVRLCSTVAGPCSAPLRIETAMWGDVVAPLGTTNFTDINALVAKQKFAANAPSKTRTKLREPLNPTTLVNASETFNCVTAFQGIPYRLTNPTPPPTCP